MSPATSLPQRLLPSDGKGRSIACGSLLNLPESALDMMICLPRHLLGRASRNYRATFCGTAVYFIMPW
jgi:hypothetical protein